MLFRSTAPLTAITAAVVGVIINLALFFAWKIWWPLATSEAPFSGKFEWFAMIVTFAAAVALMRYKANVIARAEGDGQRFKSIQTEYQKAPQVTRDRLYLDAMQSIYSSVTKVVVDSKQGNNMLYLPLDKIMQMASNPNADVTVLPSTTVAPVTAPAPTTTVDARSRDASRTRERDVR